MGDRKTAYHYLEMSLLDNETSLYLHAHKILDGEFGDIFEDEFGRLTQNALNRAHACYVRAMMCGGNIMVRRSYVNKILNGEFGEVNPEFYKMACEAAKFLADREEAMSNPESLLFDVLGYAEHLYNGYIEGFGRDESLPYYERAADAGQWLAQFRLAEIYFRDFNNSTKMQALAKGDPSFKTTKLAENFLKAEVEEEPLPDHSVPVGIDPELKRFMQEILFKDRTFRLNEELLHQFQDMRDTLERLGRTGKGIRIEFDPRAQSEFLHLLRSHDHLSASNVLKVINQGILATIEDPSTRGIGKPHPLRGRVDGQLQVYARKGNKKERIAYTWEQLEEGTVHNVRILTCRKHYES